MSVSIAWVLDELYVVPCDHADENPIYPDASSTAAAADMSARTP
ncbi:MAG: hypothetical protein OXM02_13505 [Bacteroidota bacterium]|nr:hypothetical protein [Bacteroidota bacterium]MDE2835515.1 hypothetical protein [Bacteroidota bacterium]